MDSQRISGSQTSGALVIGDGYTGLGIVRSLGRRGIPVWVLAEPHAVTRYSRYTQRAFSLRGDTNAQQAEYLLRLDAQHQLDGWTLFAEGDEGCAMIAQNCDTLAHHFRLTTPPWDVLQWAYDKRLTYRLAAEVGVDQPWMSHPRNRDEIAALDCAFPVILKPAYKKERNRFTAQKAWLARNHQELIARYDEACTLVEPDAIMVQEIIPGDRNSQFSFTAVCESGRVLACAAARRTRQHPLDFGGFSTFVETIRCPEIEGPSRLLLSKLGYSGIAEIEYKRDANSGSYKLLDINPRAWGWHALCAHAGVDFPYLMWLLVHGEPVPEIRARAGVSWVRLTYDFPTGLRAIRRGQLTLSDYFRSLKGAHHDLYVSDDLRPAIVDLLQLAQKAGNKTVHRILSTGGHVEQGRTTSAMAPLERV